MFHGFPPVKTVAAPGPQLNEEDEMEADEGCVLAYDLPKIEKVQIDASILLRLSKHGREQPRAFGQLLGMQIGDTVEISNVLPSVQTSLHGNNLSEEDRDKIDRDAEKETLSQFEKNGFDVYTVGRYASCPHDLYLSNRSVHNMMSGLETGNPCMFLALDPLRTNMGKLFLKAYAPTDNFLAMARAKLNATSETQMSDAMNIITHNIDMSGVIREIPVEITTSTLNKMFLSKLAAQPRNVTDQVLGSTHGLEKYTENAVMYMGDGMDRLRNDMQVRQYQQQQENQNPTGAGTIPLRVETRTLMTQLGQQTKYLSGVAATMAINADFAQKI